MDNMPSDANLSGGDRSLCHAEIEWMAEKY